MQVPFFVTGVSPGACPNGTRRGCISHAGSLPAGRPARLRRIVLHAGRFGLPVPAVRASRGRALPLRRFRSACRLSDCLLFPFSGFRFPVDIREPEAGRACTVSRRACRSEGARQERGGRPPGRCRASQLCILPLPAGRPVAATVALHPVALLLQSALQRGFFTISVMAEKYIVFDRT